MSFGSNLALVYQHLGRLTEAATLYENLLAIQEAILGKDHFDNVTIINNMATLKIEQNKFNEADLLFDNCLQILENQQFTNTKEYVDILYMKGLNLMNMEKYTDAKDYLAKAVIKAATVYGKYHKMYATISVNMGYLLHKSKEPKQAAKHFIDGMNTLTVGYYLLISIVIFPCKSAYFCFFSWIASREFFIKFINTL